MYARIVTVHAQPDKLEELIGIYRNSIVPAIQPAKGFLGAKLFTDRASGKGVSVTRWQTKEDLEAIESSGLYRELIAKVASFFTQPPVSEDYEISVD